MFPIDANRVKYEKMTQLTENTNTFHGHFILPTTEVAQKTYETRILKEKLTHLSSTKDI